MSHREQPRRRFLQVLAAGTAATAAGCGGTDPIDGPVGAGNLEDLPVGTLRAVSGQPVAIGRDEEGVYAMTLLCTHEQCDMSVDGSVSPSGVSCSCHGSKFDVNGAVTTGPATSALEHYAVTIDGSGAITIDGSKTVPADTRTPVPG